MDIVEAIKTRYSVRAFKVDPVPQKVLEEILTVAQRAPSWGNTQTWEFAIVGGDKIKEMGEVLSARAIAQDKRRPDITGRPEWIPTYKQRQSENGRRLYQMLGIGREDIEAETNWFVKMYGFFDAPNAIFVYTDRDISNWAIFNAGLVTQNICLAAMDYGLGTVLLGATVSFPDSVRSLLDIPESKQLIICIAIGYPDEKSELNKFRSNRVPLSEICTWHGFSARS